MKLNLNPLDRNPLSRNPRIPEATAAIKGWTRAAMRIGDEVVVSVNELSCSKPDCPPKETVVLLLPSGAAPSRISIHKAILDICERDVVEACRHGVEILEARSTHRSAR